MKKNLSIYIHIPFCYSKCYYCDFNSHTNKNDDIKKYIDYLKKEIDLYSDAFNNYTLKTVFFGGGTPSFINERYIEEVLSHIYSKIDSSSLEEVTIEANPRTLSLEKLNTYKQAGVNRISLGVQTLNDDHLKAIGRTHNSKDFYDSYEMVLKSGIKNINVDIMFNLPNQTNKDLIDTLEKVTSLDVSHISLYSLSIEEGTPFFDMYENEQISLSDEDTEREMYHRAINFLRKRGYIQYEISNFAKKDQECLHNLVYWKLNSYIGLGVSAHSNVDSYRYGNLGNMDDYFKSIDKGALPTDKESKEVIDKEMEIAEYIILGLRLNEGLDKKVFRDRYRLELEDVFGGSLKKFKDQGLIYEDKEKITLTEKGLDLCNLVFMEILPEK